MRQPLIVGNWKMNGDRSSVKQLLADLLSGIDLQIKAEVGVCVPFIFIPDVARQLQGSKISLGSQNVGDHESGAYTGEVSAQMLRDYDCQFGIVGHSERRLLYGESNEQVAARYKQAVSHDIQAILCVGETWAQREKNETFDVIDEQLKTVFDLAGASSLCRTVIAYEPVWAIGTGQTASLDQAQEVHAFIRSRIAVYDNDVAEDVRILYGGSVKPENASILFEAPDIDGGLIGGASLDAESFLSICNEIN